MLALLPLQVIPAARFERPRFTARINQPVHSRPPRKAAHDGSRATGSPDSTTNPGRTLRGHAQNEGVILAGVEDPLDRVKAALPAERANRPRYGECGFVYIAADPAGLAEVDQVASQLTVAVGSAMAAF